MSRPFALRIPVPRLLEHGCRVFVAAHGAAGLAGCFAIFLQARSMGELRFARTRRLFFTPLEADVAFRCRMPREPDRVEPSDLRGGYLAASSFAPLGLSLGFTPPSQVDHLPRSARPLVHLALLWPSSIATAVAVRSIVPQRSQPVVPFPWPSFPPFVAWE